MSHVSHCIASCLAVHALEQIPQGYFTARGPGFTSRSPDVIRRAVSQPEGDLLKLLLISMLFLVSSVDNVEQGKGGVTRTLTVL